MVWSVAILLALALAPYITLQYTQNDLKASNYTATDGRYFLYHTEAGWVKSLEMCFREGLRPATFDEQHEYDQLRSLLKIRGKGDWFWIGGSGLSENGTYVWLPTGRPLPLADWAEVKLEYNATSCLALDPADNYRPTSLCCGKELSVACEHFPSNVIKDRKMKLPYN